MFLLQVIPDQGLSALNQSERRISISRPIREQDYLPSTNRNQCERRISIPRPIREQDYWASINRSISISRQISEQDYRPSANWRGEFLSLDQSESRIICSQPIAEFLYGQQTCSRETGVVLDTLFKIKYGHFSKELKSKVFHHSSLSCQFEFNDIES